MRRFLICAMLIVFPMLCMGQHIDVKLQNRDSWKADSNGTGFRGERFCLRIDGTIDDKWSYSMRHHLNRSVSNSSMLSATDWLYMQYNPDEHWQIVAGKWMVECGGAEYYDDPIDILFSGEYYNNYNIFLFGVSAGYRFNNRKDIMTFQIAQSPFYYQAPDTYSYNLSWRGEHGCYEPSWSVNAYGYGDGGYLSNIALGNRFHFGPVTFDLDLINRADFKDFTLLKDFSIVTSLKYRPCHFLDAFVKYCADKNLECHSDLNVIAGTDIRVAGGGVEIYPIKGSESVRLHCLYYKTFGSAALNGVVAAGMSTFSAGVTFKVRLFRH